jgi:hypothetical protein
MLRARKKVGFCLWSESKDDQVSELFHTWVSDFFSVCLFRSKWQVVAEGFLIDRALTIQQSYIASFSISFAHAFSRGAHVIKKL